MQSVVIAVSSAHRAATWMKRLDTGIISPDQHGAASHAGRAPLRLEPLEERGEPPGSVGERDQAFEIPA